MKRTVVIVTLFLSLLAACGEDNVLTEGRVVGKEYDDPDTWTESYCSIYNSNGTCMIWSTREESDGPHYNIQIENRHEDEVRREWHEVSPGFYDELQGDEYVNLENESIVPR